MRARLALLWRARRVLVPFGVLTVLLVGTAIAHAIDTPDTGDADFLSPDSSAPIGSARLADEVRARGVTVVRHTDPSAALGDSAGATLFVPAAEYLDPLSMSDLEVLPGSTRVVLVDPPPRALDLAGVPLTRADRRWATAVVPPGSCTVAEGVGAAAARRQRYAVGPDVRSPAQLCFGGGVVRFDHPHDVVVIGASDPFRNDRLDEHDNRRLAADLLTSRPRLIWLDLHERERREEVEPPPATYDDPESGTRTDAPTAPSQTGRPQRPPAGGQGEGDRDSDDDGYGDASNPLGDAFPSWLWAMLATLAAALLLLILWAGRRLGPAVTEPLPVEVGSGETVLGRGRLYQRAGARDTAATVLRETARTRIGPALGLPPDPAPADVVAATAERTGLDRDRVDALLYGPIPAHDAELLDLAHGLDRLTDDVTGVGPRGPADGAGVVGPGGPADDGGFRNPTGGPDGAGAPDEGDPR